MGKVSTDLQNQPPLFVPQGTDGIDAGGAARGKVTNRDADQLDSQVPDVRCAASFPAEAHYADSDANCLHTTRLKLEQQLPGLSTY
jgi:hypothetical protein